MGTSAARARRASKPMITSANADRYALYQAAVQEPDADLDFLDRVFRARFGRLPSSLREDFAGTAYTAATWVKRRPGNTAVAIDLDPTPLAWFARHIEPTMTAAERSRLTVLREDVLGARAARSSPGRKGFDAVFAFNFSYWCFKQRQVLLGYFKKVRAAITGGGRKGLFVLDHFGGSEAMEELTERTRKKGFVYVWDQQRYDPISGDMRAAIGFEFKDGSSMRNAFVYHWRLWTLAEVRELLAEAGFASVDVYLERDDKQGRGTGVYTRRATAPADRAVIAYIVASG